MANPTTSPATSDEAGAVLVRIGQPIVGFLVERLDSVDEAAAKRVLIGIGHDAVAAIVNRLAATKPRMYTRMLSVLSAIQDPVSLDLLTEGVLDVSISPWIRLEAGEGLMKISEKTGLPIEPQVAQALENARRDIDQRVRESAELSWRDYAAKEEYWRNRF